MYKNESDIKFFITESIFKLLENKEIDNITIKEVSELSNISRTTFYNNFNNISDAINYKLNILIDEIYSLYLLNKLRKRSLDYLAKDIINYVDKNRKYFLIIKNQLFFYFKRLLDDFFLNNVSENIKYYKVSGSIINLCIAYLDNNINKKDI
ncbi:MAG: TetR/AcrR family transcriptional regulator [Bacilli bacterium]|nr:TetR/AcrR family transcriptional regulator [Bacilli bacterium]